MRLFYILGLLLCSSVSAQLIYKTVKADGSVVYSDTLSDGAVPVTLSPINAVVVPALNNAASLKTKSSTPVKKIKPAVQYQVFIRFPRPEQTLRENAGVVSVSADVSPKKAGKFQLIFDEQVVKTQLNGQFQLKNVERGAHLIQVNFLDNSGKILASSKPQTFYLHKASVLINAN